jgi:uncharacterized protein
MSTLGMVESEDILAAILFLHGLPETMYSKIGVLGLSMGATAAVLGLHVQMIFKRSLLKVAQ